MHDGGLVHHFDRSVQGGFKRSSQHSLIFSLSEDLVQGLGGCSPSERLSEPALGLAPRDNALAETINGLYRAEVIHRLWPWRSFEAVELATLEWVDWLNNWRLPEPIGIIPPAEAEARYYAQFDDLAKVA